MTTNSPTPNNRNNSFAALSGARKSSTDNLAADTIATEVADPVAEQLLSAGISFKLMPDERAEAITAARQASLNDHPLAPLAQGFASLTVPQPIPSEQTPGHSYVTFSAPSAPEEPSKLVASAVSFLQNVGEQISQGPIGRALGRLGQLMDRLEDPDTVELRKIHPLLGSGLGLRMTDADIPGHQPKE